MPDGVRLAVSCWFVKKQQTIVDKCPAVLVTTRYWRAMKFKRDKLDNQAYYPLANYLAIRGYVLVVCDARGTGASFGYRDAEISTAEVADIGEVIDWVAHQGWCDGRVATMGTSYTANTCLSSLVSNSSSLKVGVCRAPDFDLYRHLLAPGGIENIWFASEWGQITAAQDRNDIKALFEKGHIQGLPEGNANNLLGVRPVDEDKDGKMLAVAIVDHRENFNVASLVGKLQFIDGIAEAKDGTYFHFNPYFYQEEIEQSNVPMVIRCGWHDAATQLGALSMFSSFSNPMRVIIGPWNHGGDFRADPFQSGNGMQPDAILMDDVLGMTVQSLDAIFKTGQNSKPDAITDDQFGVVEYYTLGENQWKTTKFWPLQGTHMQRLYLSADYQLSWSPPAQESGRDIYQVDPTTGTGLNNRWHTQMGGPVFFPDRQEADKKLLVYDTSPLKQDIEITGHPIVHLFVRSTTTDGQFFVYLETVDSSGRVRLLTEGQLRALHRKVCDEKPPYTMFGPYHSLKEKDAEPLVPGEVAEITFDLFPLSVLLKKGQCIRLAIAGADIAVFKPLPGIEGQEITLERNKVFSSYIELPFILKD